MTGDQTTLLLIGTFVAIIFTIYRLTRDKPASEYRSYRRPLDSEVFFPAPRTDAILIRYKDRNGRITERNITPIFVVMGQGAGGHIRPSKVIAFCGNVQARRTFRIDRIEWAYVIADGIREDPVSLFQPPPGSTAALEPKVMYSLREHTAQSAEE